MAAAKTFQLTEAELADAAACLIQRSDWRIRSAYPVADEKDSTLWAWEFLRRNLDYASAFKRHRNAMKLRARVQGMVFPHIQWGVSPAADPTLSYQDAIMDYDINEDGERETHRRPLAFSGSTPVIQQPIFGPEEITEHGPKMATFSNGRLRGYTTISMRLSVNQVAVMLDLDGNLEAQFDAIRGQLAAGTWNSRDATRSRRVHLRTLTSIQDVKLIDEEQSWSTPTFKVLVGHLLPALRCVDALAESSIKRTAPIETLREVAMHFDHERNTSTSRQSSGAEEAHTYRSFEDREWSLPEVLKHLWFGLRYVLDNRYITLAATDLTSQINGSRRHQKSRTRSPAAKAG